MPARHVTPRKPHVVSVPRGGHVAGPIAFELDRLSPLVLLNDDQLGALAGVEGETIKYLRRSRGLGPRFVQVNGRPRATVAAAKEWLAGLCDAAEAENAAEKDATSGRQQATAAARRNGYPIEQAATRRLRAQKLAKENAAGSRRRHKPSSLSQ